MKVKSPIHMGRHHEYNLCHQRRTGPDMNDAEWDVLAPFINHDPKIGSPRAEAAHEKT